MAISKPSLIDLMKLLNRVLQKHRAHLGARTINQSHRKSSQMRMEISEPKDFISRTASQEIDTVEISPLHPEYMVIGTYSLVKQAEPRDYEAQTRKGSLEIIPVSTVFKPKYAGMLPPFLDKLSFPCAIVDLHFHPSDGSLLGAATSNGEVHFFRFIKHGDVLGRRLILKLVPLGFAKVAEDDQHGLSALVTQFTWFSDFSTHGIRDLNDFQRVGLAFTSSFGDTRAITLEIPAIRDLNDLRLTTTSPPDLEIQSEQVSHHDLEAWTVATIPLASTHETTTRIILSGGDDSALIASLVDLPNLSSLQSNEDSNSTVMPLWKDRRNHEAGVVAILPLPPITTSQSNSTQETTTTIPMLTGSYDETLRIFELDMQTHRPKLMTQIRLAGGVWRLKVLDQYTTLNLQEGSDSEFLIAEDNKFNTSTYRGNAEADKRNNTPNNVHKGRQGRLKQHTLILASLMHAGAMILRMTYSYKPLLSQEPWTIMPLMRFRAGHESMVYCCDARLQTPIAQDSGAQYTDEWGAKQEKVRQDGSASVDTGSELLDPVYTVVSTSFYDMKICTWRFVDEYKGEACRNAALAMK